MEFVRLGTSGLHVSRFALGTMNFGTEITEKQAFSVMDRAVELGICLFDTADVYPSPESPETWGLSEEIVGRWMKGRRDEIVLETKCVNRVGPRLNDSGGSRKHVIEACEQSLRRLGTDRIDIFYLHRSDMLEAPFEESLSALDRLVADGKVLYLGLSNFSAWQLALVLETIAKAGLTKITVLQDRYNLVSRVNEREIYPLAQAAGYGLVAYNPLGGGVLTGMFKRGDAPPASGRFTLDLYRNRYLRDEVFDIVDLVGKLADDLGCSMPQVALAWILAQEYRVNPIIGAMEPDHLTDSVKALDVQLPAEALARLGEASEAFC